MTRITIKEVAQAAQVSITTVSHVINETRFVNPDTRQRVLEAMAQLGYHPNTLARSLRSGITKMIGLIVPDASNPFFGEIARKIEDMGFKKGYSVVLCNSDDDPVKQASYIDTLLAIQVDGVIFISSGGEPGDLERLAHNNITLVVADRDVPLELADVVLLDNEQAGYDATRHLIDLGHRAIACITGPNHLSPSMQRMEGYKRCLREFGIPIYPGFIEKGDFHYQGGKEAMLRLLSASRRPTAVFVLNDMMAIGAMAVAQKEGFVVPHDLSIIGFDDIEIDSAVTPSLTTMRQPIDEMAQRVTGILLDRLSEERKDMNQKVLLKAGLIVRNSTSSPKP